MGDDLSQSPPSIDDIELPSSCLSLAEAVEKDAEQEPARDRPIRRIQASPWAFTPLAEQDLPVPSRPSPVMPPLEPVVEVPLKSDQPFDLLDTPLEAIPIQRSGSSQAALAGNQVSLQEGTEIAQSDDRNRKKARKAEAFVQWIQVALEQKLNEPAARSALKKNHLLVLMILLNHLEFRNEIILSQREIADMVGFPSSRLSAILSVLEDLDFLTRGVGTSRTFTLLMNPRYFLKESKSSWSEIQEKYGNLREARVAAKKRGASPREGGRLLSSEKEELMNNSHNDG